MKVYIWRVKTRLPERYMTTCKVLARGKLNSCLVEFEDGYRVVTSRNYLKIYYLISHPGFAARGLDDSPFFLNLHVTDPTPYITLCYFVL